MVKFIIAPFCIILPTMRAKHGDTRKAWRNVLTHSESGSGKPCTNE